eukprot:scaffold1867_cov122-Cylindrotheca_fusiformis.AAC.7
MTNFLAAYPCRISESPKFPPRGIPNSLQPRAFLPVVAVEGIPFELDAYKCLSLISFSYVVDNEADLIFRRPSCAMDYLRLNRMRTSTQKLASIAADRSSRRREIVGVVGKYEGKEILSLVELYLWTVKIDQVSSKNEQIFVDRQGCRIMSGAAIVILVSIS